MDIGSNSKGVQGRLSNFTARIFEFDGITCGSLEGILQALKQKAVPMQQYMCTLIGFKAKKKGYKLNWRTNQELYWNTNVYQRKDKAYQELLDLIYESCYRDGRSGLKKDLELTGKAVFSHSIGKRKESETVLTEREFCSRLQKLKDEGTLFPVGYNWVIPQHKDILGENNEK